MAITTFVRRSAALALVACAVGAAADTLNLIADPLDLSNEMPSDYRNWASVLSQVLLKKEGSESAAADALGRVMLAAHGHLAKVANGEELFPRFHLADPVFAGESHGLGDAIEDVVGKFSGKVKSKIPTTSVTKFAASKTFFNFAPCVLQESKVGLAAGLTGLNFAPNLLSFFPTGFFGQAVGVNIVPQLLWITPIGVNIQPQGLNVQPGLIYIGPIGTNVQPQGVNIQPIKIAVAPVGKNIQPQGKLVAPAKLVYAPVKTLYNPQKGPVYAPIGDDLTTLDDNKPDNAGGDTGGGGL